MRVELHTAPDETCYVEPDNVTVVRASFEEHRNTQIFFTGGQRVDVVEDIDTVLKALRSVPHRNATPAPSTRQRTRPQAPKPPKPPKPKPPKN